MAAASAVCLVHAPGAAGRPEASAALPTTFVKWTKTLNGDFRDLNGTLHTGADSLADFVTKVARLYAIADRVQEHAAAAQDDLENDIASGSDAQLAKRRALKAFDLLSRSAAQWKLYAKCAGFGKNVPGLLTGCATSVTRGFFDPDIFDTLSTEKQAELEQELQGYLRQAKSLSGNAAKLLKLANEGLGNPLKAKVTTTTKPVSADLPVVESPATAPFAITNASLPSTVKANGPRGDLTVTWSGNPTFPVRMTYAPDSCGPGLNCTSPVATFTQRANPLVFKGSVWCAGTFTTAIFFDYSVYLQDAKGVRTAKKNADFTCQPG